MANKKTKPTSQLLRWNKNVPASEVQDPLGLSLRGSTRLASRLLFCITSITPRARYFAFIPWCIYNYQRHEKGKPYALGLRAAIKVRETALTLASVIHHEGEPCDGGALVGSTKAGKWFEKGNSEANLKQLDFAKFPALDAYYNSLVNLGCFVTDEERADSDEEAKEIEFTFDDIELSPLGLQLAEGYESLIGRLDSVKSVSTSHRKCSVNSLREWGKRGGLCELVETNAPDQPLLREVFFAKSNFDEKNSHGFRNRSLVLILALCRQLSPDEWLLNEPNFGMAVYYGEVVNEEGDRISVEWPTSLADIAKRWRMFYFHHYMSVALEGMFAWLVTQVLGQGVSGTMTSELSAGMDSATVRHELEEFLNCKLTKNFGSSSPSAFFQHFAVMAQSLDETSSQNIDDVIRAECQVAEHWLEEAIRKRRFLHSPTGLAIPLILFVLSLARYARWAGTDYGNWLARAANDPYLDLIPPIVSQGLERYFGDWWTCSWTVLADYVLSRYVVQQHQSMSYEKTAAGERCLLQVDGQKIISDFSYEKIGIGNPRLGSAIQVLKDLALLEDDQDGLTHLTNDGRAMLQAELNDGSKQ